MARRPAIGVAVVLALVTIVAPVSFFLLPRYVYEHGLNLNLKQVAVVGSGVTLLALITLLAASIASRFSKRRR